MAQTKQEIQSILADAGSEPRHRFGQNFMIDRNLVRLVAEAGEVAAGDLVIEVGPGTGTLTEELLGRGAEVVAVEIDRDLAAALRRRLEDRLGALAGAFGRFVQQLFSARRKTLRKGLSQAGYPADALIAGQGLDPQARPETLSPAELHSLFAAASLEPRDGHP